MQLSEMSDINCWEGYNTAVYIKNLTKSYDNEVNSKELVLNKFCMRVKKGSIYGFLGASGCGKTTVLSCIVGLKKWDSGQILVFGREPGSEENCFRARTLGYMPQDLALYNQLSIIETIKFYGRLYNMPDLAIREQWKKLSELLDLSNSGSKLIGSLSGGQQRRASLAVALIHSPQLLILDEPTVGLDPVLRENIWNYLYQIAGQLGATIIITTHYIEEARYSDTIGLMRRGRMLVEDNPSELMKHYESDLLEQVIMQICRVDQQASSITSDTAGIYGSKLDKTEKIKFKSSWKLKNDQIACNEVLEVKFRALSSDDIEKGYLENQCLKTKPEKKNYKFLQSLQKTFGFTWVIFLIVFRYPMFLMLIVMLPALQGTISLLAIGSKPLSLPFGIVNHEVGDWDTACESTQNLTYIENKLTSGCYLNSESNFLSCKYLNQLKMDKLVNLISFNTEKEARKQVKMGNTWGYMIIPEIFSQSFGDLLIAKQYIMNASIEGSRIPIHLDYSQYISSLFITRSMFNSFSNYMEQLAKSCSIDQKIVEIPLNFRRPIYGDNEDNYTAFVMPGVLIFTIFGIVSILSELLLITDRRQGTLSRATVAGLSCYDVIFSHLIVQGVLTLAQLAIWNIVLYFIFSIYFNGQVWLYVLICLLTGLSASALGIFLGLIVSTEAKAFYIFSFLNNLLILYGSIIWPSEAMTKFWQTVGSILPTYLPTKSLRSVTVRGVGIEHRLVWPGILSSVIWILGLVILSVLLCRKKT